MVEINAILNIQIRVAANQAKREIASVGGAIRQAQAVANSGSAAGGLTGLVNKFGIGNTAVSNFAKTVDRMGGVAAKAFRQFPAWNKAMERMGKNMQWVGRQLEFNFTLPLVAGGYFATKWALQNEKATIQVKKVYGDLSFTQQRVNEETNALSRSFELLSNRFGVNQAEVINTAAAWAAAGSAGRGLAENTRATLEAMIIGDMEAADATNALISIMATYRLSSKKSADGTSELGDALADLNIIENQTGIQFKGLIDVIQRSGGSASQAGVDIRHLAAMAAALVPATGSAAQAGNSLRTMISRLQAPTRDTIDVLQKMGIEVMSPDWLGKTATEKIEFMAESFNNLSTAQQTLVSSVVASRWQVNRFARLMEDISSKTGYYQKALDATSDTQQKSGEYTRQQLTYWKELGTVLDSNPKKFEILANVIKNNLTSAVIPLLPALQSILATFALMAEQFANLDPHTQRFIVFGLAFLAITGPIVRLMGAWILLMSQVGKGLFHVGQAFFWMGKQAIAALGWVLSSLANMIIGEGTVASAWSAGEASRAQATVAANEVIIAANAAGASSGAQAGAAQAASANAAARATAYAWMRAFSETGLAYMAWLDSFALGQGAAAAASGGAAAASAASWERAALVSATAQTAAMVEIGAAQMVVPQLALPAAAATRSIWTRTFLAIVTPIRAIVTRIGVFIMTALEGTIAAIAGFIGLPFWAVVAIIAAVAAAIVLILKTDIEDPVIRVVQSIARGIAALPRIFSNVLSTVARVVASWIRVIWDLLSYLNPFSRHSPSLVDMVKAGVSTILDQYSNLRRIGPMLLGAVRAHEAFNKAIASTQAGFDATERGEQRQIVQSVAPAAVPQFDAVSAQIDALKSVLPALTAEIDRQATITARWQAQVDALNRVLDHEKFVLSQLQDQLSAIEDQINDAQSVLSELGDTDLPGMRAMEDQIFANEMAQKALRLEILKMGEAGQSIEDLRQRMADLAGMIEMLRGEREALRLAGAGSDILSAYDAEIAALEAQQEAIESQGDAMQDLIDQLDELQTQAEILDLESALKFDGPLRQIDQMIDGLNEMPFDQIVAEIQKQKNKLATLQPQYDSILAKVKAQELVVGLIQKKHDIANQQLQAENDKLQAMEQAYSDINAQIQAMETSMNNFASAAQAAKDAAAAGSTAEQLFDAGEGADFETPIGGDLLGAEGTLADIEAFNAELQKELENVMADMGGVDIFGGLRDKFNGFKSFVMDWGRLLGPILIGAFFGPWGLLVGLVVGLLIKFGPTIWKGLRGAWDWAWKKLTPYVRTLMSVFSTVWDAGWKAIGTIISFVWNSIIKPILDAIGWFFNNVLVPAFQLVAAVALWAWQTVIYPAIQMAWDFIKPIFEAIWGFIQGYLLPIFQLFAAIVEIVFVLIARAIQWAWENVIKPVFDWVWGFITGNLGPAFNLLMTVVQVVFGAIWYAIQWAWKNVIQPVFSAIWGFIKNTLGPVFSWLWNNVVKPAFGGVGSVISSVWNGVIKPIFDGIVWALKNVVGPAFTWLKDKIVKPVWDGIKSIISGAWDGIKTILESGINAMISVFNFLARGVNRIGDALSINVNVSEMKKVNLASGGVLGGRPTRQMADGGFIPPAPAGGFHGKQARAIVTEGSRIHREFVIPTDPKYRQRALMLFRLLANDLGMTPGDSAPGMAAGGIVPHLGVGDVLDWTGDKVAGAARAVKAFWDLINKAINGIGSIGNRVIKDAARFMKDLVVDWGEEQIKKIPGVGLAGDIIGGAIGIGGDVVSGIGNLNPFAAQGMVLPYGINELANGGRMLVGRHADGVLFRAGEGRTDEQVQVLPLSGDEGEGGTTNNFYGDLVFPNITDPADAEKFIKNLETLGAA